MLWSKRSPGLLPVICWMTLDDPGRINFPFAALSFPSRISASRSRRCLKSNVLGLFSLGPSPDPPPSQPARHTALDPPEPGSWIVNCEERKILWPDWQQGNRKVVRVRDQVPQVSAGYVCTPHWSDEHSSTCCFSKRKNKMLIPNADKGGMKLVVVARLSMGSILWTI